MSKRSERPESIVPFYMYGGQTPPPATSRFSVRSVLLWSAALALIGLVSWLYLLQASQVATYEYEIRTLQMDKERLHRQNAILNGQVAQLGSLDRIRFVAEAWGYTLPKAGDPQRHMTLAYTRVPTPVAPDEGSTPLAGALELPARGRLLDRLMAQMRAWLDSAQTGEEPQRRPEG